MKNRLDKMDEKLDKIFEHAGKFYHAKKRAAKKKMAFKAV